MSEKNKCLKFYDFARDCHVKAGEPVKNEKAGDLQPIIQPNIYRILQKVNQDIYTSDTIYMLNSMILAQAVPQIFCSQGYIGLQCKSKKGGITLQWQVWWKRKKIYTYFSYLFHILNFKILSLTILDRMQRVMGAPIHSKTDRPKPICPLNFKLLQSWGIKGKFDAFKIIRGILYRKIDIHEWRENHSTCFTKVSLKICSWRVAQWYNTLVVTEHSSQ